MKNYNNLSKEELIKLLNIKDKTITDQDKTIKNQDKTIANQDKTITKQDKTIKNQDKTIEKLDKKIAKQEAEIRSLNLQIEQLIAKYEDKLEASKLHLVEQYIPSNEKLKDEDLVINELEVIKEKKTRKSPTESFIKDLKDINRGEDIIIDYDFKDMDTSHIKEFGVDETYKLEYKPASFEVIKVIKKKYKDKDKIYEGIYDDPFPHSSLTPSLAANLIEMKFNLGVPFYRYSNYLIAHGINISDTDIYHYADKTMKLLEPLYDKLKESLINTPFKVIHSDETPLKVINSNKENCYVFVYTTSFWDHTIYIYDFNDSRKVDKTKELLKDYEGYLVCDGYVGYDCLRKEGIKLQRCMVHARRYFVECLKVLPEDKRKSSPAYKVIELMAVLFKHEEDYRKRKLTANEIKEERNKNYYKKDIKTLNDYINKIDISNNELLSRAVNYYKKYKDELFTYLESGYVDISNNLAERAVKPFVIARKNFLFCKTSDGALTTGKLFSIIQTARANGLKSEQYLTYVISNINKKDINDLLPWSTNLPKELLIKQKE